MRILLLLAALLLASAGIFAVRGREALAERDRAHEDLLGRERRLDELLRDQGARGDDFAAQIEEHARVVALARQRLDLIEGTAPSAPRPRLTTLLAASTLESLRPGGALHESVRTQAGLPAGAIEAEPATPSLQELALAQLVQVLGSTGAPLSVDRLQLRGRTEPVPVAGVKELRVVEAQLEVSGALPDVLAALEALAPIDGGGLPAITVKDAAVRRIEPSSWGENLHRLATPPVRLTASIDVLLRAPEGS